MRYLISLLALPLLSYGEAPKDILRFTNGDQLHGTYEGISENGSILWSRQDIKEPLVLKPDSVRHIILQGASQQTDANAYSYVTLKNGDQIPGRVLNLSEKSVTIQSTAVGEITVPFEAVSAICPNPFGGKLLYAGPFSPDGWEIAPPRQAEDGNNGKAEVKAAPDADADAKAEDKVKPKEKKETPAWQHNGCAWYHLAGPQPLIRKNCLSNSTSIRFRIAWRERLTANIVLHADFMEAPKDKNNEAEGANKPVKGKQPMAFINGLQQNQSVSFGNALVLNLYQTYFSMTRCGYDATGTPIAQRMAHTQSNVQLPDSGEATIEIRSDRNKGLLMLFINGQYAAQWEELDPLLHNGEKADDNANMPLGNGFAIQSTNGNTPLRLSDMVIIEWNGIKDSAYSMSNEHRDIVLLSNGTDRYSGQVVSVKNNIAFFKTAYSELQIPLAEISEIVFAKKEQTAPEEAKEGTVTACFYPTGKISGLPLPSAKKILEINHSSAAKLRVDLSNAIALEFSDENPFLEAMDNNNEKKLLPDADVIQDE
jgi:hypothetical protein